MPLSFSFLFFFAFHVVSSILSHKYTHSYKQIPKEVANGREMGISFWLKIQDMKNTHRVIKTGKKDFLNLLIPYGIFKEKEGLELSTTTTAVSGTSSTSSTTTGAQVTSKKITPVSSTTIFPKDSIVKRSASSMTICSNMHHLSFKVIPSGKSFWSTLFLFFRVVLVDDVLG